MKLRFSPTSPYVRKVVVTAMERGLDGQIERIPTNTRDPQSGLSGDNPLGKVPCLILDNGERLFDSPVICAYLDSLAEGEPLIPATGEARWRALRQEALADGIQDAALLRMGEAMRRPEQYRWPAFIEAQRKKVVRALDTLELEVDQLNGPLTLGQIAVGCALGYLDLRFAEDDWRSGRPKLAAWYEDFVARPSMMATVPKEA